MYEHHRQTIENLQARYENDPGSLALIVIGSVGRDEARPESDLDFYLVVPQLVYEAGLARHATAFCPVQKPTVT
jgi:UTP:GlnB (protein PII) uridylyltransferase